MNPQHTDSGYLSEIMRGEKRAIYKESSNPNSKIPIFEYTVSSNSLGLMKDNFIFEMQKKI